MRATTPAVPFIAYGWGMPKAKARRGGRLWAVLELCSEAALAALGVSLGTALCVAILLADASAARSHRRR